MSTPFTDCPCCNCVEDGCCESPCVDCPASPTYYDIDLVITSTSQSGSVSGSKSIAPCVSRCNNPCTKVAADGAVTGRIDNRTSSTIHVLFAFTVSGLGTGCTLNARFNCEVGGGFYSNGTQNWFQVEVSPNSVYTFQVDHRVQGNGCCEQGNASIGSWTYSTSVPAVVGYCCGGSLGDVEANPGCTDPLVAQFYPDSCANCSTYVGTCAVFSCPSCPSGSAWYYVTGWSCPGVQCLLDGTFSCCVP